MSDRAWMYTGYTSQKVWTKEWLRKTKGFVGAAVGDVTTECKPPRRGRFTLNYIGAHEDSEDGILLIKLRGLEPKGGLGPIVVNRHSHITCIVR